MYDLKLDAVITKLMILFSCNCVFLFIELIVMKIQPILQDKPPYQKFLYFLFIVFASLILINLLGLLIAIPFYGRSFADSFSGGYDFSDAITLSKLKYLQIVNQFAMFIVPVLLFAMFSGNSISGYLKLNTKAAPVSLLLAAGVIIAGLPLLNCITQWNAGMSFPKAFSGIEHWMRTSETLNDNLTTAFLGTTSAWGFVVNLLMMSILPAIGEELFFRGVVQRVFAEWFRNIHVAVIVTAFIFSAIHFQFFGFVPRFLLGMFLGYVFYWTGSLWAPIMVHFINNGLAVCVAFLAARGLVNQNYNTFGSSDNVWVIVLSTLTISGMMLLLYKFRRNNKALV